MNISLRKRNDILTSTTTGFREAFRHAAEKHGFHSGYFNYRDSKFRKVALALGGRHKLDEGSDGMCFPLEIWGINFNIVNGFKIAFFGKSIYLIDGQADPKSVGLVMHLSTSELTENFDRDVAILLDYTTRIIKFFTVHYDSLEVLCQAVLKADDEFKVLLAKRLIGEWRTADSIALNSLLIHPYAKFDKLRRSSNLEEILGLIADKVQ